MSGTIHVLGFRQLTHQHISFSSTYILEEGKMVEKPPTLKPGKRECHVICHDEVCFHANDLSRTEWVARGEQPLRQKERGRIVHVSDFIIEQTGQLCLDKHKREAQMKLPCMPEMGASAIARTEEIKVIKGVVKKE